MLEQKEIEKVPESLSPDECYHRIREWLQDNGIFLIKSEKEKSGQEFYKKFLQILPENPRPEDRDFVYHAVTAGPLEAFSDTRDDNGIKIAAYAYNALKQKTGNFRGNEATKTNSRNSILQEKMNKIQREIDNMRKKYEPQTLAININADGLPGASHTLAWDNKLRVLKYIEDDVHQRFVPTAAEWEEFWEEMDRLNVWNWQERYESDKPQGKKWDIYIQKNESKEVKSSGIGAFPPDSQPEVSRIFLNFYEAVSHLCSRILHT